MAERKEFNTGLSCLLTPLPTPSRLHRKGGAQLPFPGHKVESVDGAYKPCQTEACPWGWGVVAPPPFLCGLLWEGSPS